MSTPPAVFAGLAAFGDRLAQRRADIMKAWEARVIADPKLMTGNALPKSQLHDHLTAMLEDFERRLSSTTDRTSEASLGAQVGDGAAHGLHRWQQGFDLAELIRELGRLNESVVEEIDRCGTHPPFAGNHELLSRVHTIWAAIYSNTTSSSAEQFFKLQQLEAAGQVKDLEQALASLRALEVQRAAVWQEAAHDLRGNLNVVSLVAAGLTSPAGDADKRKKFVVALDRNVRALNDILEDVTSLARLQGGQEKRVVGEVDVAQLLHELAAAMEGLAQERGLEFTAEGPAPFMIEGDATKIRRIVQNLVVNALRYTRKGRVSVTWGAEPGRETLRWLVQIEDTGPGIQIGPGSALAGAISVASEQARDVGKAQAQGDVVHVSTKDAPPAIAADTRGTSQKPGEGIGLSIVKRLCTLLDATIEMDSKPERGTVFRILFPHRYGG